MKRIIYVVVCAVIPVLSCTEQASLKFVEQNGAWVPEPRSLSAFVSGLKTADAGRAYSMIDRAFAEADSLGAMKSTSETVGRLSDGIFSGLTSEGASAGDYELVARMLDREAMCSTLDPIDFKRIDYKRGRLNLNRPGFMVNDFPVVSTDGGECMLCGLFTKRTVLFVYGASCKECDRMMEEIQRSQFIRKAQADSSLNLVALYTGEDKGEFRAKSSKLAGWTSVMDRDNAVLYENAFDSGLVPSFYLVSENGIVDVKAARSLKAIEKADAEAGRTCIEIVLDTDESVWGGKIADGQYMPFRDSSYLTLFENGGNQVQPLILTSKGRYVWSDQPFKYHIKDGVLYVDNALAEINTAKVGTSLADAYRFAQKAFFPVEGLLPPVEFFEKPQWNTWLELQYNQNQKDILEYARGIIRNGLPAGIIMIDDTWQEDYGKWVFHPGRFPDPKAMCDELHRMGFKVMLWVTPFVSMDQYEICVKVGDGFLKKEGVGTYPVYWWNGYSASIDFSNGQGYRWFDEELSRLVNEFGVDGFKFDAGDFNLFPSDAISAGNMTAWEYCAAFAGFGEKYPYNEFRAAWKSGGKPLVQRLHDKGHSWQALNALIPEMMAANLNGYWFCAPDMIGGGSFASFLPGCVIDSDLVVRSAQVHALMPMMQFSVAPWRILDRTHLNAVLEAVRIRDRFLDRIVELMHNASVTGEPVVAPLEFYFPHQGLAAVKNQFMLGPDMMVAPMTEPGTTRTVALPCGRWLSDDGKVYEGGQTVTIEVPLERIPYFHAI